MGPCAASTHDERVQGMGERLVGWFETPFSIRHRVAVLNPVDVPEAELQARSGLGKEPAVDPKRRHVMSS